ncbi:Cro/CI family transcriptional regulator [Snodgrassella sp. CFCC 13594]|uniref:Cro/CI family transcriptional regulator n=1 Tax=Snodgrassella sp. CFCC 13594 TaxID=1775559 RepID=UPI0009EF4CFA|nr:Cro/CI family transcriptional regulator [Snodgrassella sp. CFCC 13594]
MRKSDVITYYGSGIAVARVLKISSSAVSQWALLIPEKQAYRLEKITQGQLKVDPSLYDDQSSTI